MTRGDRLFRAMRTHFPKHPLGLVEIPDFNPERGFFPGACGSWEDHDREKRLLLLGQDFGTLEAYQQARPTGEDGRVGTWLQLLNLIPVHQWGDCFFSNVLMGVREDGPITGPSPGLADPEFCDLCADFLYEQIKLIDPDAIALLGNEAAQVFDRMLQRRVPTESDRFAGPIRKVDRENGQNPMPVGIADRSRAVARFLHPSFRVPNRRHRMPIALQKPNKADLEAVDVLECGLMKALLLPRPCESKT